MNYSNFWILALVLGIFLFSCKREDDCSSEPFTHMDTLVLYFTATASGESLEYNKVFKDPINRDMRVSQFIHYVSQINLINAGTRTLIKDIDIVIYEDKGALDPNDENQKLKIIAPVGSFTGIEFAIGIDSILNASDPTSYPNEHPLSVNQGTYWSAWDKYRFVMIEGRIDGNGDGLIDDIFGFHTGHDVCYRNMAYNKNFEISKGGSNELRFSIEINDLFFGEDTLDIYTEPNFHGELSLIDRALKISDNFKRGLKLE